MHTSNGEKDPLKMDDLPCRGVLCRVALHRSHSYSLLLYNPASFGMQITCVGDTGHTVVALRELEPSVTVHRKPLHVLEFITAGREVT